MVSYRTKKEVTHSLPQQKLLLTNQGDCMILLKLPKVNIYLQTFKFTLNFKVKFQFWSKVKFSIRKAYCFFINTISKTKLQ